MTKEEVDMVFEKFYQVTGIKNHQIGTGLGMSICKDIVGYHGGKIWLLSEKDKGTTVYFTLPKVMEKA